MPNAAIFIGWNRPSVGREQQAMQVFQKSLEFYGKLQSDGRIESFEPVILSAHGGDLNGFVLLRGDAEKLAEIRRDERGQLDGCHFSLGKTFQLITPGSFCFG
jgi:hypothetical protein